MSLSPLKYATSHTYRNALRVGLVVGSILFLINHGEAVLKGTMSRERWISGVLSYCCPFCVNLHGQCQQLAKQNKPNSPIVPMH